MHETAYAMRTDLDARERKPDVSSTNSVSPAGIKSADIGLLPAERQAVVNLLNRLLADEFVLYTKTRRFHWNVEGPYFFELHALFQKQYEELAEIIDNVAERARALDGIAAGSLEEYLQLTRLVEHPGGGYDGRGALAALLADHESLVRSLRLDLETCSEQYRGEGTTDFLTGLMQAHEKMAWMLRAHLR